MSHLVKTKISPAIINRPLKTPNKVLTLTSAALISIAAANASAQKPSEAIVPQQITLNQTVDGTEHNITPQQNGVPLKPLTSQNAMTQEKKSPSVNEKTATTNSNGSTSAEIKKDKFQFSKKTKMSAGLGVAGMYTLIFSAFIGSFINSNIFNTKLTKTQIGMNITGGALLGASFANSPLIGAALSCLAVCCYKYARKISTSAIPQEKKLHK